MSNKNNSQNHANNGNNNGAEVKVDHIAPAVAAGVEVIEAAPENNGMNVDEKAAAAVLTATATESVNLGWKDIGVGSVLGGFATFARRTATKLMVEGYNETTGDTIESDSWGSIAAHTAASAVATGAIVGVLQKTVMKDMHPIKQGGIVIVTSQAVNLIDAIVGDMAANAIVGGKAKLTDMFSKEEPVVVAEEA